MSGKTGKSNDQTQTDQTQTAGAGSTAGGDQTTTGAGAGDQTTSGGDQTTGAGDQTATTGTDTQAGAGDQTTGTGDQTGAGTGDQTGAGTDTQAGAGDQTATGDYATAQDPAATKAMLEGTELVRPTDPEGKPTGAKKSYIAVFGGPMVNPYTEDVFTGEASKPVKLDSWIKRQMSEGKIVEAPEDDE